jgi:hypothetical protein
LKVIEKLLQSTDQILLKLMLRDKETEKGRRKSDSKIIHRITNGKNGKCDKSDRSKSNSVSG